MMRGLTKSSWKASLYHFYLPNTVDPYSIDEEVLFSEEVHPVALIVEESYYK